MSLINILSAMYLSNNYFNPLICLLAHLIVSSLKLIRSNQLCNQALQSIRTVSTQLTYR